MNWESFANGLVDRLTVEGGPLDILALGGPVVMVLVLLSVVMIAITLLKLAQFLRAGVGRHADADRTVEAYVEGRPLPRAGSTTLSAVVVDRLLSVRTVDEHARENAESFAALRLHQLRKLVGLLDTIAQISPLLGLFGTVLGMIEAFKALEGAGAAVDPSILAGGIWVALLTTAVGLAVAMPASVVASWFEARLENERVAIDTLITRAVTGRQALGEPVAAR